jgi:protein SCO1/2
MLCPMVEDGAANALRATGLRIGTDYRAITVSIDPSDRPETSRQWRRRIAGVLHAPPDLDWRFLTGNQPAITRLTNALGFHYARDPESGQYSHAALIFVLTPDGRIARYLYGIDFDPVRLRSALSDAAAGRTGGAVERLLLRCYHYVPALRRHAGLVVWTLRLGGLLVVGAVAGPLVWLWRRGPPGPGGPRGADARSAS